MFGFIPNSLAKVRAGERERGGDRETREGTRQRVRIVHSPARWNLNTGNSGASPVGLFMIKT